MLVNPGVWWSLATYHPIDGIRFPHLFQPLKTFQDFLRFPNPTVRPPNLFKGFPFSKNHLQKTNKNKEILQTTTICNKKTHPTNELRNNILTSPRNSSFYSPIVVLSVPSPESPSRIAGACPYEGTPGGDFFMLTRRAITTWSRNRWKNMFINEDLEPQLFALRHFDALCKHPYRPCSC